jgi:hypothetical protein
VEQDAVSLLRTTEVDILFLGCVHPMVRRQRRIVGQQLNDTRSGVHVCAMPQAADLGATKVEREFRDSGVPTRLTLETLSAIQGHVKNAIASRIDFGDTYIPASVWLPLHPKSAYAGAVRNDLVRCHEE